MTSEFNLTCPIPLQNHSHVLLAHGGGGKLMHQLIEQLFLPAFGTASQPQHDAATLQLIGIHLNQIQIPIREDVRGACELLGFDPLYVANEGRFVAILPETEAPKALEILHRYSGLSDRAAIIGHVSANNSGLVTMQNQIGTTRIIELLSGQQLPRIC